MVIALLNVLAVSRSGAAMCPILAFLASVLGLFERDVNLIYVMYMFILACFHCVFVLAYSF